MATEPLLPQSLFETRTLSRQQFSPQKNYPARIEGGVFYGMVSASGPISVDLVDTTSDNSAMYDGAELRTWETYTLSASLDGNPHQRQFHCYHSRSKSNLCIRRFWKFSSYRGTNFHC